MSGILQTSNQAYISNLNITNYWFLVVNSFLFCGLFICLRNNFKIILQKKYFLNLGILIIATVTVIPTLVETRYFLLLHISIYSFIIYSVNESQMIQLNTKPIIIAQNIFYLFIIFGGIHFFASKLSSWVTIYQ